MNRLKKLLLLVFVLPLTLFFDFIIFSLTKTCPSCGSFSQWLSSEAALSFPLIVLLGEWINRILTELKVNPPSQKTKVFKK